MIKKSEQIDKDISLTEYPMCQDLKVELKILEEILNRLTENKIEIETKINYFNNDYMAQLGGLIEEILKLRIAIYNTNTKYGPKPNIKSNLMLEEAIEDYEEFQFNFHSFQIASQDSPQLLDESEIKQLKIAYHKASRLCHPDKLSEDQQIRGQDIFKMLNNANRNQDLKLVQDILLKLESEADYLGIAGKKNDNRNELLQRINLLNEQIAMLEPEIKCLKESEIYQRIQAITDMDGYFAELERELQAELAVLKGKRVRRNP